MKASLPLSHLVRPSVTFSFPHDNSSSLYPIFIKLHMCIDINEGKTPIEYELYPSKVKVTVARNRLLCKMFVSA